MLSLHSVACSSVCSCNELGGLSGVPVLCLSNVWHGGAQTLESAVNERQYAYKPCLLRSQMLENPVS